MAILAMLLSVAVSAVLVWWLLALKKEDPFPRGTVVQILLCGLLTYAVSALTTIVLTLGKAVSRLGVSNLLALFQVRTAEEAEEALAALRTEPTLFGIFINTLLAVALVEEAVKFIHLRLIARKSGVVKNRLDAVVCGALVGIGFQVFEDIGYAGSGGVALAILRALTPFHFLFGAIMGRFYGRYLADKRPADLVLAVAVPTLLHALFDFGINALDDFEEMFLFAALYTLALIALTVVLIVKINRWKQDENMKAPL